MPLYKKVHTIPTKDTVSLMNEVAEEFMRQSNMALFKVSKCNNAIGKYLSQDLKDIEAHLDPFRSPNLGGAIKDFSQLTEKELSDDEIFTLIFDKRPSTSKAPKPQDPKPNPDEKKQEKPLSYKEAMDKLTVPPNMSWADICEAEEDLLKENQEDAKRALDVLQQLEALTLANAAVSNVILLPKNFDVVFPRLHGYVTSCAKLLGVKVEMEGTDVKSAGALHGGFWSKDPEPTVKDLRNKGEFQTLKSLFDINALFAGLVKRVDKIELKQKRSGDLGRYYVCATAASIFEEQSLGTPLGKSKKALRHADGGRKVLISEFASLFTKDGLKYANTLMGVVDTLLRKLTRSAINKGKSKNYFEGLAKAVRASGSACVYARSRTIQRPVRKQVTEQRGKRTEKKVITVQKTGKVGPLCSQNREYLSLNERKCSEAFNNTIKDLYTRIDQIPESVTLGEFGEKVDLVVSGLYKITDSFNALVKERKALIRNESRKTIISEKKDDKKFDRAFIRIDPTTWANAKTKVMNDHDSRDQESFGIISQMTVSKISDKDQVNSVVKAISAKPGWLDLF